MNPMERAVQYIASNSAHECGHMTVLFKAERLAGLDFLPHELAFDGAKGVLETATRTELGREDCVALAAGMVAELIYSGSSRHAGDDEQRVEQIAGQPLEDFALEAYDAIQQNLLFFGLLNIAVQAKMLVFFIKTFSLSDADYAVLPPRMSIFNLAEVGEVYQRAEDTLASFGEKRA